MGDDPRVIDLGFQLDVAARLFAASVFGAAIGVEREVHGHPAGMRTHLLVSLGSALFTVLSIFGFPLGSGQAADPSRVAAQIVSGIGFLGAGAIIKEGLSVRGLTTAASLWATAAVGMAVGAGHFIVALVAAGIILFSLWPLNRLADRIHGVEKQMTEVRLAFRKLGALAEVSRLLTEQGLEIVGVRTERMEDRGYRADIGLRVRASANLAEALARIGNLDGVEVLASSGADD
jgi:putative Mg2+ transporter-C (MgtC) family protein